MKDSIEFNIALDDFYKYIYGILEHYVKALPLIKAELESIRKDDIASLKEELRPQNVLLMQTKNFDKKIHEHLSRLNISAENLTDFIRQLPDEKQLRFYDLLGRFEATLAEVNFYKEKCRVLLQSKLYNIEKALYIKTAGKDIKTYDSSAGEIRSDLFPKSFETLI